MEELESSLKFLDSGFIDRYKIKRPLKYQKFHQNLSDEDLIPMETDIEKNGLKDPVKLDQDYNLLDGYTRDEIIGNLKQKQILYNRYEFASEAEKIEFIKSENRNRRHLTIYQKCQWGKVVYDREQQAAEERQKRGTLASPDTKGRAREIAADAAGVSPSTFDRFLTVDNSPLRVNRQKDLESGKLALKTAANMVKLQKNHEKPVKLAKGIFNCIVEDPPTKFNNGPGIRGSADLHYTTLPIQKICDTKMPAAENCVYFEWISTSMKHDTQTVRINGKELTGSTIQCILKAREARAVTEFILPKKKPGKGSYNFSMHETCIMAFKGKMPLPAKRFPSVLPVFDGEHSEKPDIFYQWVRQMYPKCKRYAPFERKQREGFVCGGDQLKKSWCGDCGKHHELHNAGPEDCDCKCHKHIVLKLTIKSGVGKNDIIYEFNPADKKLPLASPIWSGVIKDNKKQVDEITDRVTDWYRKKFNRTVIVITQFGPEACPKCKGKEGKEKVHVVINSKVCGIINIKEHKGKVINAKYAFSKDLKLYDKRADPGISCSNVGGGSVIFGPINAIQSDVNSLQRVYKRPIKIQVVKKL